jgi:KAP family P-loop domain
MIAGTTEEFGADAGKHTNPSGQYCPGRTFLAKQVGVGGSYDNTVECTTCHREFTAFGNKLAQSLDPNTLSLVEVLKSTPLPPVEDIAGLVLQELVKIGNEEHAGNFAARFTGRPALEARTPAVSSIFEAFSWLQSRDMIAPAYQAGWYFVTAKGLEIGTAANLKAYLAKQQKSSGGASEEQAGRERDGAYRDPDKSLVNSKEQDGAANSSQQAKEVESAGEEDSIETSSISDVPTLNDSLGFKPYVEAIARFLLNPSTKPPLTLSIEGEWGSGKSSFMLQLSQALDRGSLWRRVASAWKMNSNEQRSRLRRLWDVAGERRQLRVQFNPWRHDKEESVWAAFALEFLRQVSRQRPPVRRWWGTGILFLRRYSWRARIEALRAIATWLLLILLFVGIPFELFVKKPQWAHDVLTALAEKPSTSGEPKATAGHLLTGAQIDQEEKSPDLNLILGALLGIGGSAAAYVAVALSICIKAKDLVGNPLEIDLKKYLRSPDYEERVAFVERFHRDFKHVVNAYAGKQKVFVFIDDLDRCEVPKAADLMKAVNLLIADDPRLVFILGMDREKVAAGLAVKYEKLLPYVAADLPVETGLVDWKRRVGLEFGQSFLQKFIQLPFRVPEPNIDHYMPFLQTISAPLLGSVNSGDVPQARADSMDRPLNAPLATSPEQRRARRERELQLTGDSQKVRDVAMMVARELDANPRRLKQFINLFRLQAYIVNELGFFDENRPDAERITFEQLGKFVAISLKWPAVLADFAGQPDLFDELQRPSAAGTPKSAAAEQWSEDTKFMNFLRHGTERQNKAYTLTNPALYQLLRISPARVKTIPDS